jgi:hypothetical protein
MHSKLNVQVQLVAEQRGGRSATGALQLGAVLRHCEERVRRRVTSTVAHLPLVLLSSLLCPRARLDFANISPRQMFCLTLAMFVLKLMVVMKHRRECNR